MDARKIMVANIGPIGGIPYIRDLNSSAGNDCVALPNHLANLFIKQLKGLLQDLNNSLEGSIFIYANVNHIVEDIPHNFKSYGFDHADSACCHLAGKYGGMVPCLPPSKVCPNRSKYVFWDPYHLSDTTHTIIAKRLIDGHIEDISPLNLRALFKH
ncbi:hypothetical protein L1987_09369 [Smallanthus sonchifolius]|uniref:Uncharacterized protein n=1 Tax=Smallanthus sonchifolius TaxID=185202 RepID=A0ACB9JNS4_9ASTR|nr:hypothetical protein L1987_09369 [Smallanthus sonchifolius]